MARNLVGAAILFWLTAGHALAAAPTAAQFAEAPGRASAVLAPSGRQVLLVRSDATTGDTLTVRDLASGAERVVHRTAAGEKRFLRDAEWKDEARVLFVAESPYSTMNGDSSTLRLFLLTLSTGAVKPLLTDVAPSYGGGYGRLDILSTLPGDRDRIVVQILNRRGLLQLWRVDLTSGRVEDLEGSDGSTLRWYVDGAGRAVLRQDISGRTRLVLRRADDGWREFFRLRRSNFQQAPLFEVYGPGPAPGEVYVYARAEGRDLGAIYLFDPRRGELGAAVHQDAQSDAVFLLPSRAARTPLIGCRELQRIECAGLTDRWRAMWPQLRRGIDPDDDVLPVSSSDGDNVMLVQSFGPRNPGAWHVFDADEGSMRQLLRVAPGLERAALARTSVLHFKASDGVPLWSYLTSAGEARAPLVVFPHGGPEARDSYKYDWVVQFLATRGYAVLQPNFRGSSGAGAAFAGAGYGEWGRRMQADVVDGVRAAIAAGAADPARICAVGGSYGGYVALMAAVQTPELFKCVASIGAVADLEGIVDYERGGGRFSLEFAYAKLSIGDPATDRAALRDRSPLYQAARIRTPTLLIHGRFDPVSPFAQSDSLRKAMIRAGAAPEWMEVEGGHRWSGWKVEDRTRFLETLDGFLVRHIGAAPR